MTKIEQAALEIATELDGEPRGDITNASDDDIGNIIKLIVDAIVQLIEAWAANCGSIKPFSRLVRRPGILGGARARLVIREQADNHGLKGVVQSGRVWRAARNSLSRHDDQWLDEMAAELRRPDWGV